MPVYDDFIWDGARRGGLSLPDPGYAEPYRGEDAAYDGALLPGARPRTYTAEDDARALAGLPVRSWEELLADLRVPDVQPPAQVSSTAVLTPAAARLLAEDAAAGAAHRDGAAMLAEELALHGGDADDAARRILAGLKTKERVMDLQRMLVDAGYDIGSFGESGDGVDGMLGRRTREAARKWFADIDAQGRMEAESEAKAAGQAAESAGLGPAVEAGFSPFAALPAIFGLPPHATVKRVEPRSFAEPHTPEEVRELQAKLAEAGYDVGAIDGVMGPRTRKAMEEYNARFVGGAGGADASYPIPSFTQYMYATGSMGGKPGSKFKMNWNRRMNLKDEGSTFFNSLIGRDSELGEGAKRQLVAQWLLPNSTGAKYDYDVLLGGASTGIGSDLKGKYAVNGREVSEREARMAFPVRFTVGQNNFATNPDFKAGTYKDKDGNYVLKDPTDYHVVTLFDEDGNKTNRNISDFDGHIPGSVFGDLLHMAKGDMGLLPLAENVGGRLGAKGAIKTAHVSAKDIDRYKEEYERFKNDPKMRQKYYDAIDAYGLKGW